MTTLAAWKTTVASNVASSIPDTTIEQALVYVDAYLTSVGGWTPVSMSFPIDDGAPANGASEGDAATQIVTDQYADIYSIDFTVQAVLNVTMPIHLTPSLDDNSVLAAFSTALSDWVTAQLGATKVTLNTVSSYTGVVTDNGITTGAIRRAIETKYTGISKLIDPRAIALKIATDRHTLDNTWNVSKVYLQAGGDIVTIIEKYTSNNYNTRDLTATKFIVISLNPDTYQLSYGIQQSYP